MFRIARFGPGSTPHQPYPLAAWQLLRELTRAPTSVELRWHGSRWAPPTPESSTSRHSQRQPRPSEVSPGRRRHLALTLVDIVANPTRLAEASAEEMAYLYGSVEVIRARIVARLPNASALRPPAQAPAAEYLTLKDLAAYCAIGMRRLRDHLTDPGHPLPHFRVGGKILIRRSDFESWLIAYRRVGAPDVERIVHEVVSAVAP